MKFTLQRQKVRMSRGLKVALAFAPSEALMYNEDTRI